MSMVRYHQRIALTLDSVLADTPEIPYGEFDGGQINIPTGSPITTLTYHVAPIRGGTYLPAHTEAGVAVTQTVEAAKSYPFPLALRHAGAIKITTNADGAVEVCLKS